MDAIEKYTAFLGQNVEVTIDRPLGSPHPRLGFIYETNYGFLPDTKAGDGDEIDAYVIGEREPLESFSGKCIAVIVRKDDDEHKLVVGRSDETEANIMQAVRFVEDHYDTELILAGDTCNSVNI